MSKISDVVKAARKVASSAKDESMSIIIGGLCSIIDNLEVENEKLKDLLNDENVEWCIKAKQILEGE